jgi:hypothetical protein
MNAMITEILAKYQLEATLAKKKFIIWYYHKRFHKTEAKYEHLKGKSRRRSDLVHI